MLLKAKGHVWHKSSMIKGVVPCSGIDIDARWGFSHTKQWIFGYKLHITASTGSLIVPLSADITRADIQDNQIYPAITCSSSLPHGVRYVAAADSGYDDHKLYNLSIDRRGFELVCPVSEIYNHTSADRLQLINFYLWIRIRTGNSFLEIHIRRAINRTYQRCFQNRSFTSKRISESSWYNSIISTTLSNYCLLQLQDTQTTKSKSYQTHVR